jgi:hypothetical protein
MLSKMENVGVPQTQAPFYKVGNRHNFATPFVIMEVHIRSWRITQANCLHLGGAQFFQSVSIMKESIMPSNCTL